MRNGERRRRGGEEQDRGLWGCRGILVFSQIDIGDRDTNRENGLSKIGDHCVRDWNGMMECIY
jgi:hypothetical protein